MAIEIIALDLFNLIDITETLKKEVVIKDRGLFVGKTKKTFLIGPRISKNFCVECFKKRIKSSAFFEAKDYLTISSNDIEKIKKLLLLTRRVSSNKMIEYILEGDRWSVYFIHFLLPVPGCVCQKKER